MSEKRNKIDRRNFLKTVGAAGLGSVYICGSASGAGEPSKAGDVKKKAKKEESKLPQVPTRPISSKISERVPILSLGAMFNVSQNQVILRKCLDWGVNYWDTANSYAGGTSETGIGNFLEANPDVRKDVFIVSKASRAESMEDVEARLQTSLKRMKTSYIDLYYGVHAMNNPADLTDELRKWAESAKKRKLIRYFGFSTHKNMAECLLAASKLDWIDAIMTTYNYRVMQDEKLESAVEQCFSKGIGLIAMKVQARGQKIEAKGDRAIAAKFLQSDYSEGQAKLKSVLQDERFCSACTKMQNIAMLTSNVAASLDRTTLSRSDMDVLKGYAAGSCGGYCAGCANICDSVLPDAGYVSDVMRYLMYYNSYGEQERARASFARIPRAVRSRLLGVDYKAAEAKCPQGLAIGKLVAEAVSKLA
ncbi:MAG: aldo/keto reductase [Planctomycetes bacterium]|nr:aldo/keto reductase [Planctomycetota bacterium]